MNKTGIEYGDLSWNFYPGCLHKQQGKCPVPKCWAEGTWNNRRMPSAAKKGVILPDFHHPALIPELLLAPLSVKKPSTILVDFMGDLMGDWVNPFLPIGKDIEIEFPKEYRGIKVRHDVSLRETVLRVCEESPQHRFVFLTKNPENYAKWGKWPENAWLGATVCDAGMFYDSCDALNRVKAKNKWLSIEPLFEALNGGECEGKRLDMLRGLIKWVVIGAQSQPTVMPELSWVEEIVRACEAAGIPVWLKDNLRPLIEPVRKKTYVILNNAINDTNHDLFYKEIQNEPDKCKYRQETPWEIASEKTKVIKLIAGKSIRTGDYVIVNKRGYVVPANNGDATVFTADKNYKKGETLTIQVSRKS